MEKVDQTVRCDVLVIGGAVAGMTAAIEARSRGADVLIAAKGRVGRSGNVIVAGGQFSTVVPYPGCEDSPEHHFQDSLEGGCGLNDERLLRILASEGGTQLLKLEEWGVPFLRVDGELVRRMPPGHRYARGIPADISAFPSTVGSQAITLPIRKTALRLGVRFLERAPVVRLLLSEGRVRGALLIDLERGQPVLVEAGAVVVAAGGGGRLYSNTNNTRDVSGDSYAFLLQAGATLRDMEFVQYYPVQMTSPYRAVVNAAAGADGAVLRNRQGEAFMHRYDPVNGEKATRDVMSRAIFSEVEKGDGIDGQVYYDWTGVPSDAVERKYGLFARELRKHGVDLSRDWIKVGTATHFFMGGAVVDERCDTGVPGLYAAGEAVGGVHGANRLGGNALVEAMVFGPIAGRSAAEFAAGEGRHLEIPRCFEGIAVSEGVASPVEEIRVALREAMWKGASIVRSEASLQSALATVRECSAALVGSPASSWMEVARREEMRLMRLTAESIVLSALARLESRGAHYRDDYPSTEERWLGSNHVRLAESGLEVEFVPKIARR